MADAALERALCAPVRDWYGHRFPRLPDAATARSPPVRDDELTPLELRFFRDVVEPRRRAVYRTTTRTGSRASCRSAR